MNSWYKNRDGRVTQNWPFAAARVLAADAAPRSRRLRAVLTVRPRFALVASTLALVLLAAACSSSTSQGTTGATGPPTTVSLAESVVVPPLAPVDPPPLLAEAAQGCGREPAATSNAVTRQACTSAADAYVWGYALVAMMRTRQRFVCELGSNVLRNATTLAGPSSQSVVSPNNDTLYSTAWLDLRASPMVLTFPAVSGRYANFQMMDAYSNTFADVGVLTTDGRAGRFAVVAPGWKGTLPSGVVRIDSPTPDVWLLGRTAVDGPADLPNVIAIQHQYGLAPLDPTATTEAGEPPSPLATCGPSPQQIAGTGLPILDEISADMVTNPPLAQDRAVVAEMAKGGIGPGLHPTASADASTTAGYDLGLGIGKKIMQDGADSARVTTSTGWTHGRVVGTYGTDYVARADVAAVGLAAQVETEAMYFNAPDATTTLTGKSTYVMHFAKGQLPPFGPDGFWSLTIYDHQHFLVANPIDRYSIGDRTNGLVTNTDGSLDIYIAAAAPAGHQSNWLPAPTGRFTLTLRVYAPEQSAIDGSWVPPTVKES